MQDLKQQAGALFIVGFHGLTPDAEIKHLIRDYHVAGVILFARNIESPQQLARLTDALQAEAKAAGYQAPLLIALDQENGVIRRLTAGAAALPGAMAIAATGKPENATLVYQATAKELRALGVNWDLAPDADVNTDSRNPVIGVRAFGDDAKAVSQYVQGATKGLQQNGVAACLKHFPGHGNTAVDSHLALPVLKRSLAELQATELLPFVAGIESNVAAVMVAHLMLPALDEKRPTSLAPSVMAELLRKQLGFPGIIVTDDLEMNAIADYFGAPAACVLALQAGADLAMVSHVPETQEQGLAAVMAAIENGQLTAADVAAKAARVQRMRTRYGSWQNGFSSTAFAAQVAADEALAERLYRRSVTQVKPAAQPLAGAPLVITLTHQQLSRVVDFTPATDPLWQAAHELLPAAHQRVLDLTAPDLKALLAGITDETPVIIGTSNIKGAEDVQARVVAALTLRSRQVHVIACRNPYDQQWLPAVASYTTTYEPTKAALLVAIAGLMGAEQPTGRLPVVLR